MNSKNRIMKESKNMNYPFSLLTEYFLRENKIDTTKTYEICEIPARELIKYNRFDLMAKWLYIDSLEKGLASKFAYHVYYDNINAFSCGNFTEPGSEEKSSFKRYTDDLEKLVDDIKIRGFDASISLIPVGMNDELIDGSHRVSVAAYFDRKVSIIRFPELKRTYSYDYSFFRKYMMSDISMGYMAIQYAHLKNNCYMACLWPKADTDRMDEVEDRLRSIGNIVYSQEVYLTYQGICNFMVQIYGNQPWTGNIDNHFDGVHEKARACYREGKPIKTYLFEAENLEFVVEIKKEIREIFQIENHSIHISDNWQETLDMAEMLYNRNSVEFMNKATPYVYSKTYKKLLKLKRMIDERGYDKSRFIIDSSAVLEVCGLRQAADLDFLTDYVLEEEIMIDGVDNHASQLPYYGVALSDMLYSPENYVYFNGMKFITPQRLAEMKKRRGEVKDVRDVKILRKYMNKKVKVPREYRFEVIDRIYNYQIEQHLYGKGPLTYTQYRNKLISNYLKRMKACVKKPLSIIYHSFFGDKMRRNQAEREREKWIYSQRNRLKNKDVTIIASNCNGGFISSDLGLPFRSPFVNLFIKASDYIKVLSDLRGYMDEPLRFVKETDPIYGDVTYPTAYLRDVKIYFMHYRSEQEAAKAWERRKGRINWNNIYVIFTDRSGCTMEDLTAFDALPYENKIVFTHIPQLEIRSSYYIKGYENESKVGILSDWQDEEQPVKRVYDQFDFVEWFNEKMI